MPRAIDTDELQRLLGEQNVQLVEVLPASNYEKEHIRSAINIPLRELDDRAPVELERERPVVVYCNDYQ